MRITLDIPDNKYKFFLELVNSLDFIKIEESEAVPQWQQDEVARRLDLIEKGELKTRSYEEAKKDIFKR
jgi:hypothetical protein